MKKVFIMIVAVLLGEVTTAQKVYRNREVASVAMGNTKLIEIEGKYSLKLRTQNSVDEYMYVDLGDSVNAVRLLTFISELKISDEDVVVLENPSGNTIQKGPMGSFKVFDEFKAAYGYTHHTYVKKMLNALTGKEKKKDKAYRRRYKTD